MNHEKDKGNPQDNDDALVQYEYAEELSLSENVNDFPAAEIIEPATKIEPDSFSPEMSDDYIPVEMNQELRTAIEEFEAECDIECGQQEQQKQELLSMEEPFYTEEVTAEVTEETSIEVTAPLIAEVTTEVTEETSIDPIVEAAPVLVTENTPIEPTTPLVKEVTEKVTPPLSTAEMTAEVTAPLATEEASLEATEALTTPGITEEVTPPLVTENTEDKKITEENTEFLKDIAEEIRGSETDSVASITEVDAKRGEQLFIPLVETYVSPTKHTSQENSNPDPVAAKQETSETLMKTDSLLPPVEGAPPNTTGERGEVLPKDTVEELRENKKAHKMIERETLLKPTVVEKITAEPLADLPIELDRNEVYARNFLIDADEDLAQAIHDIPSRLAFKIGDAAKIVGVKSYVLRYWETEFKSLKPQKAKNNQRVYMRRDVETALIIKKLLHKDRFSIEGACSILQKMRTETKKAKAIYSTRVEKSQSLQEKTQQLLIHIREMQASLSE